VRRGVFLWFFHFTHLVAEDPSLVGVFLAGRGNDVQFNFSDISDTTPEVLHLRVQRTNGDGHYHPMCLTGSHSQTASALTSVIFVLPGDVIQASTGPQEHRMTCRQLKCTRSHEAAADHRLKVEGKQSDGVGDCLALVR
jgi:hypothetical protein